jgi:ABC-type multidrug transport system ATPase subunit
VLFLDEPTSGLDSMTAHALLMTLKQVAMLNHTIIFTIHQPRTDIFNILDDVMLLSTGQLVYFGPSKNMVGYFSR